MNINENLIKNNNNLKSIIVKKTNKRSNEESLQNPNKKVRTAGLSIISTSNQENNRKREHQEQETNKVFKRIKKESHTENSKKSDLSSETTLYAYNEALKKNMGNIKKIEQIYQELLQQGLKPDVYTYGSLFSCYSRANQTKEASEMFRKMQEAGYEIKRQAYDRMMFLYMQDKKIEEAEKLLKEMEQQASLKPTVHIYGFFFNFYIQADQADQTKKAIQMFHKMQEAHFKIHRKTYTCMIHLYAKNDNVKEAEIVLKQMVEAEIDPDHITFTSLLNLYTRTKYFEGSPYLLEQIQKTKNLQLDRLMYKALFYLYAMKEDVKEADHVLNQMRIRKFAPSKKMYNYLLNLSVMKKDRPSITKILKQMSEDKITADVVTYTTLLKLYLTFDVKLGGLLIGHHINS